MDDNYGTAQRERMKRILQEPEGQWRPMNRRHNDNHNGIMAVFVGIIIGAILSGGIYYVSR